MQHNKGKWEGRDVGDVSHIVHTYGQLRRYLLEGFNSLGLIIYIYLVCMCVCPFEHAMHLELRGQLAVVGYLFLPCGF